MGKKDRIKRKRDRDAEADAEAEGADGGESGAFRDGKRRIKFGEMNPKFEAYYKAQNIIPEGEWAKFAEVLARPLPVALRISDLDPRAADVRARLQTAFEGKPVDVDGEVVEPPKELTWYPNKNGWQFLFDRKVFRKSPELKKLHHYIQAKTASGIVSRQEAVSMIPPLVLQVEPHHRVLDMCASPGSKTVQLLEALHRDEDATGVPPSGFVVANDASSKRAYLLHHQCKRVGSPSLIITCHDAQLFPTLNRMTRDESEARSIHPGTFDRILADVPCSGDGTMRKNAELWTTWTPNLGYGIHRIQFLIARRGLALLKVGGLMVYSTCSLNPVEDEAVVAKLLRSAKGSLELVDYSHMLKGLKRHPGLTTWKIFNTQMTHTYENIEEFHAETAELSAKHRRAPRRPPIDPEMFPPTPKELEWMHLERCCRLLPHDQDTGGFFVALLRKTNIAAGRLSAPVSDDKFPARAGAGGPSAAGAGGGAAGAGAGAAGAAGASAVGAGASAAGAADAVGAAAGAGGAADAAKSSPKAEVAAPAPDTADGSKKEAVADKPEPAAEEKKEGDGPKASGGGASRSDGNKGKKKKGAMLEEQRYRPIDSASFETIKEAYGLRPDFPVELLYTRSEVGRIVTMLTPPIAEECIPKLPDVEEPTQMDLDKGKRKLKVVTSGLKVFQSQGPSRGVGFPRIVQEGAHLILPYITKRVIFINPEDALYVLELKQPNVDVGFLSEQTRKEVDELTDGSFMFVVKGFGQSVGLEGDVIRPQSEPGLPAARRSGTLYRGGAVRMAFSMWRGHHAVSLMASKEDRSPMVDLVRRHLGLPEVTPEEVLGVNNRGPDARDAPAAASAAGAGAGAGAGAEVAASAGVGDEPAAVAAAAPAAESSAAASAPAE